MEYLIIFLLSLFSIALFLIEIFFIPGITIAGIGGLLLAGGAIYYAYNMGTTVLICTLIAYVVVMSIGILYFFKAKTWNKLALNTDIISKVESQTQHISIGDCGITLSRLAPIGQIKINGIIVEAKAEEELIDEEMEVIVTSVQSNNVTVRPKNN